MFRIHNNHRAVSGFTIVELLIVVVVIAILAAIVIVAYGGVQSRAHDAVIKSDFHNLANLLEMYQVKHGSYPHDPAGDPGYLCDQASGTELKPTLGAIDMKLSVGSYDTTPNANVLYIASNDGAQFALLAYAQGNPTYVITDKLKTAVEYVPSGTITQSKFPGGTPCGVADHLGISSTSTNLDFAFYYVFVKGAGGFRIWS